MMAMQTDEQRATPLHSIERWDDATGENRIEEIARVGDYLVAMQTYLAAVRRWPDAKITLRSRENIIEQSWEDKAAARPLSQAPAQ
jgi:hypothetical protein